uniref:Uncharacterized protein n=1 Tax=Glossina palpalis gambiensis TaxID=67801 RepID=A0A1B0B399_9MUSC
RQLSIAKTFNSQCPEGEQYLGVPQFTHGVIGGDMLGVAPAPKNMAEPPNILLPNVLASIPCKVISDNILASMQRKNMSSSILSTASSSSWNLFSSLFMIRIRSTNLSALSSLNMQFRSSPKPALIFSAICSMVNFLSVIRFRSNSIRNSHGEMRVGSKSGIS